MNNWIKIALRNILKNKRRSLVTIMAIAVGFASVSLFQGYIDYLYYGLREIAVRGEGLGHLNIYHKGWFDQGQIYPERYMISKEEIDKISEIVSNNEHAILATPQLNISGLVSNGTISRIFIAKGVIPENDRIIQGDWDKFKPVKGNRINSGNILGVEVAEKLAASLDLKPGGQAVVMATTLEGQMNALDIDVLGVFDTGMSATNDKFIRVTYDFAQSLYDTEHADRMVILLEDWRQTEAVRGILATKLSEAGLDFEIKTWMEMSNFYLKTKMMYDAIFVFLFSIVFVIVVMSIMNTMGMTVLERTREIGTLRALGLKQSGVQMLFAIEGGLIGMIGSLLGIVLNLICYGAIRYYQPTFIPPNFSSPVPLLVNLVPIAIIFFIGFLILLALFASIIPARKAARKNIVDALGHV